jgi:demethylmenaquinone methyltransferase/2-methoxy-6-polyprenyl-1,4-benzoquinol methylase
MKSDFGFGFREPRQKTRDVQSLFARIAQRYDIMNDAMSLGLHRLWKQEFINALPLAHLPSPGAAHLLDVATGTGDIPERLYTRTQGLKMPCTFVVCDLNEEMLKAGQKRLPHHPFHWQLANAEALPFEPDSFDLYTIAFGLRNVTHKETALQEAFRVLKKGGFFYCLEFSHPESPWMQGLYDLYSFGWIPLLGKVLANDKAAYTYLVESIRVFPHPALLETLIQEAGFQKTGYRLLSQGLVAIHWGQKV